METNPSNEMNEKEEMALALILQGRKDAEVAEALGVSRMTIWRWKKYDAGFIQALEEKRAHLRQQAEDNILELTESAVNAIRDALNENDPRIRLQAANLVFGILRDNKGKEKEGSSILELLGEAITGIQSELGLDKPL